MLDILKPKAGMPGWKKSGNFGGKIATCDKEKANLMSNIACLDHDLEEQYIGWKCTRCGHSQIFAPWEGLDDDEYSDDEEECPDDH